MAAAFWGTNQALRIAGGSGAEPRLDGAGGSGAEPRLDGAGVQAGATGGGPWQEAVVTACHAIPGLALIVAWTILVWGTWQVCRSSATGTH